MGTGAITIPGCPQEYIGRELTEAIGGLDLCEHGALPVTGGIEDQSAWAMRVWQLLKSEDAQVTREKLEDGRRRH